MRIFPEKEALSAAAARLFTEEARRVAAVKRRFDVLLSGGETPARTYQLLGEEPLRDQVPWGKVRLFWGDERHVPQSDPRSNFGMVRSVLLDHLALDERQIHPIPFQQSAEDSALRYEEELKEHFAAAPPTFDLVFLGLGDDGHTASLFPGSPVLKERDRWVRAVSQPGQELQRVTVTAPVLNQAALVVFLVCGAGKAQVLQQVLEGERDKEPLPAQMIRPVNGRLLWLVDAAAARLLSAETADARKG